MSETSLAVEIREGTGKGVARRLRATGRAPAVLYGHGTENVHLSIDPKSLDRALRSGHAGMNTLFDLRGDASLAGRTVLVKELQRHPVRGDVLHADLFEVDQNERITVSVPIHLSGSAKGVVMGGIVDHSLRELELDCLPRAIPDQIEVDISELDIGDSLHVRDLALPEGVELRTDEDLSVVSVATPIAEEVAEVAEEVEGEEGAKPEGEEAKDESSEEGGKSTGE